MQLKSSLCITHATIKIWENIPTSPDVLIFLLNGTFVGNLTIRWLQRKPFLNGFHPHISPCTIVIHLHKTTCSIFLKCFPNISQQRSFTYMSHTSSFFSQQTKEHSISVIWWSSMRMTLDFLLKQVYRWWKMMYLLLFFLRSCFQCTCCCFSRGVLVLLLLLLFLLLLRYQ